MDPQRYQRLKELLLSAHALPPEEREAHVRAASGDDQELAAEALSLLAEDAAPARIVEEGPLPEGLLEARHPEEIGPYQIAGVLGEGGMGVVYRALQSEPIRREVAIKLVRGGMHSKSILRRFHWERQSLARMSHPHIASVLDAGSDEHGRPWFVMPLVEGRPLTKYCDEEQLSVEDRLVLFEEICHAVQHAHQRGVLHRDLKPGNILVRRVQGRSVPTIIDFGIARSLQPGAEELSAGLTMEGQRIGTPAYMSPEQLRGDDGDIDTRSDVYALGVILYELLAGRHPWAETGETAPTSIGAAAAVSPSMAIGLSDAAMRATERGTSVRDLKRRLRGDLDTICLTAVRPEPERRYPSAGQLADDLERFRRNERVWARPDSFKYRTEKYIQRHPARAAASALTFVALIGASIFLIWHADRLQAERDRALAAEAKAQSEMQVTERALDFMEGLFETANPGGDREVGDLSARELLQQGAGRIDAELGDEPYLAGKVAVSLGGLYHTLHMLEASDSLTVLSAGYIERMDDPQSDRAKLLRATLLNLRSVIYHDQGRYAEAADNDTEFIALRRELHGDDSYEVAAALIGAGLNIQAQDKVEEGIPYIEEAVAIYSRITEGPDSEYAYALGTLAYLRTKLGYYHEAKVEFKKALEITREVYAGQDNFELIFALNNYGGVCNTLNDLDEAERTSREALEMCRRMYAESEHPWTARMTQRMGLIEAKRGNLETAEALFKESLEIRQRTQGMEHVRTALSWQALGLFYVDQGRLAEAEAALLEGDRIEALHLPDDHTIRATYALSMGRLRYAQGDYEEAVAQFEAFYHHMESTNRPVHWHNGEAKSWLGRALIASGNLESGRPLLEEGHAFLLDYFGEDHPKVKRNEAWLSEL